MAVDPNGIGFAELFTVEQTAEGYLQLAKEYLAKGNIARAHAMLVISYQAKAKENARA